MAFQRQNWANTFGEPTNHGLADIVKAFRDSQAMGRNDELAQYNNAMKRSEAQYADQYFEGEALEKYGKGSTENSIAELLRQGLGGHNQNQPMNSNMSQGNGLADSIYQGGQPQQEQYQDQDYQQPNQGMQQRQMGQNPYLNPLAAAIIQKKFGGPAAEQKYDPATGMVHSIYTDPITGIPHAQSSQVGPGVHEQVFDKESGTAAAKALAAASDSLNTGYMVMDNIDAIKSIIGDYPDQFSNAVGPMDQWIKRHMGEDETQRMQGLLRSLSGNIKLVYANALKGAFTGRDQQMLDDLKANIGDPPQTFIGKLNAMEMMLRMSNKRNELVGHYLRQGMPEDLAVKTARDQTSFKAMEQQFRDDGILTIPITKYADQYEKDEARDLFGENTNSTDFE